LIRKNSVGRIVKETRVLFVCLGNICRSPTAEGVFRELVNQKGVADQISIDSAGTGDWHIGRPADVRAAQAALSRGYDLSSLRARQAIADDFRQFDYVLAMDESNLNNLRQLAPVDFQGYLGLFLDFSQQDEYTEVPDPYYGGEQGFELVLDLIEDASEGLLQHILSRRQ
jgi:protein-tyrosine phosphatase